MGRPLAGTFGRRIVRAACPAFLAGQATQAETEKELSALMPSILDKAFEGEL
jgi:hypothetical protein